MPAYRQLQPPSKFPLRRKTVINNVTRAMKDIYCKVKQVPAVCVPCHVLPCKYLSLRSAKLYPLQATG
eukprot:6174240-Pleurochrysis_carterae.AAC.5